MAGTTWSRLMLVAAVAAAMLFAATEFGQAASWTGLGRARRVVVDPGHGGKDPGTMRGSIHEKDLALNIGHQLASDLISSGVKTAMTRTGDRFIELDDRAALGNRVGADLFVSVHINSNPDHSMHGFTIYTAPNAGSRTMAIARSIERSMSAAGFYSQGIQQRRLRVLTESRGPAVLVECGFLSNAAEATAMQSSRQKSRYALAIASGILHAFNER